MSTPVPPTPNPEFEQVRPGEPYRYANPQNRGERFINRLPAQSRYVNLPGNAPRFLADRATIFYAWMTAMVIIGFDEWHNLHILPRPARFWDATLVYGVLILFSMADSVVPLANAFAVGYTIVLLWQYYQGGITPAGDNSQTANSNNGNPFSFIIGQATGQVPGSTQINSGNGQVVVPVGNATGLFPTIGPINPQPSPQPAPGG